MREATEFFQCALVTGASAGLGEEFARQLAPRCARLVLVARRGERMADLAADLQQRHPGLQVDRFVVDLADRAARARLLEELSYAEIQPDLLVNNAGLGDCGEFIEADWGKLERMLEVNINALTHLTHALLPGMGPGAAVLNVSSMASILPIPDFGVYAATKAYVTSFSEALRIEVRDAGVRVLALCPGPVHTEFGAVAGEGSKGQKVPGREWFYVAKEQVVAEALAALELGRPRHYPGWKVALAAAGITLLPIAMVRIAMSFRPRRAQ
jgi:short-subunit dehydrogenase